MKTSFTTNILGIGNNTGIEVPAENVAALGTSKRPPVNVDVNGYKYNGTVAVMDGRYLISFAKAHREASGLGAGDKVEVILELDEGVREVAVPAALRSALDKANLSVLFDTLAYSRRKEFARQVSEAKSDETRNRRIEKIINQLQ